MRELLALLGAIGAVGIYFLWSLGPDRSPVGQLVDSRVVAREQANVRGRLATPGKFELSDAVQRGAVNVVELYEKGCDDCDLGPSYRRLLDLRPDVVVTRVRMSEYESEDQALEDYGVRVSETPYVLILDEDGKPYIRRRGFYQVDLLRDWLHEEEKYASGGPRASGGIEKIRRGLERVEESAEGLQQLQEAQLALDEN